MIRRQGPWRSLEQVEFATLAWVDWFNNRRLLGSIGDIPPVEWEGPCSGCVAAGEGQLESRDVDRAEDHVLRGLHETE